MVGRNTSSHTHGWTASVYILGKLALPPYILHSAGTEAARCSFSFVKIITFSVSQQKKIPRCIKYVFNKYTFKSKKMQVY